MDSAAPQHDQFLGRGERSVAHANLEHVPIAQDQGMPIAKAFVAAMVVGAVIASAIVAKTSGIAPPLLDTARVGWQTGEPDTTHGTTRGTTNGPRDGNLLNTQATEDSGDPLDNNDAELDGSSVHADTLACRIARSGFSSRMSGLGPPLPDADPSRRFLPDADLRWFGGRPARPDKVMWLTVTGYSPDARSCGDSADGITSTLHGVTTNGHRLFAADPAVLAYGTMLSVPGYNEDMIAPVLDCGSAIKGPRLDVLFPTHEEARRWGVRLVPVTVWEYADGQPASNPRKER